MELHISVNNKVATYQKRDGDIVCGNSDYTIRFTFDEEWDSVADKTARFNYNGMHTDKPIVDGVCEVPIFQNVPIVDVGVYGGELCTTTPASIVCKKSILCEDTTIDPDEGKVYEEECARLAQEAAESAERAEEAADRADYPKAGEGEGSVVANDTVQAISEYSAAFGLDNTVGGRGYQVNQIVGNVVTIATKGQPVDLEAGDVCSIYYASTTGATAQVYDFGTILNIDNGTNERAINLNTVPEFTDVDDLDNELTVLFVLSKLTGSVEIAPNAIVAGSENVNLATNGSLLGGTGNKLTGINSAIVAGKDGDIKSPRSAIVSGNGNSIEIEASNAAIVAGAENRTAGKRSAVVAGNNNSIGENCNNSAIIAGANNEVHNQRSLIGCGQHNVNRGKNSAIFGEYNELATSTIGDIIGGSRNTVNGNNSAVFGSGNNNSASGTAVAGYNNTVGENGYSSACFGANNNVNGYENIMSGTNNESTGHYSSTFGRHLKNRGRAQFVVGEYNVRDSKGGNVERGNYIEIVGNGTDDNNRSNARTLDWSGNETLAGKLTVGASPTNGMDVTTKQYVDEHYVTAGQKEGTTIGNKSTTEGNNTTASGLYSHAEGYLTVANGNITHAEGARTIASDNGAHAEGYDTTASGFVSHAEGDHTVASGMYSHAEGNYTVASGNSSHAEGHRAEAIGESSHAEGNSTTATGNYSHAEGNGTSAEYAAHAEGTDTTASGLSSHTEGYGTVSTHIAQHVVGQYNAIDPSENAYNERGTYIEIVGNGTADNARSNARTLDWQGNETLAGNQRAKNIHAVTDDHVSISGEVKNSVIMGDYATIQDANKDIVAGDSDIKNTSHSIVIGNGNAVDSASYAMIVGANNTIDNAENSLIKGYQNDTWAVDSRIIGNKNFIGVAGGDSSIIGSQNTIFENAPYNHITGFDNVINAGCDRSYIIGRNNIIPANTYNSFVIGRSNYGYNDAVIVGRYNEETPIATDRFVVGAGENGSRRNSFASGHDGSESYIRIGNTTITEAQLKALLALLA